MDALKRFQQWMWKEWRDHRAIVCGILLAIPALTALGFWAFGEHLATAWMRSTRAVYLGIAVGLVVFAVAGDLFAGETRRGTMRTVRRLPGAFGTAFLAKIVFLTALLCVVIAWQGVCLAIAEAGNGGIAMDLGLREGIDGGPARAMALLEGVAAFPTGELWINGLGYGVLALWTLLVSSWMGRSGVAGIGALVLLGALASPFFLFFQEHPYFFPGPLVLAGWAAGVSALVALAACALSFLRGARFEGRPLRPFLLGASVLLVALGGGYAYASASLDAWLDLDPQADDFHIMDAHVGAGEGHLYVTVHRGQAWNGGKLLLLHHALNQGVKERRGTPLQAWVVDLGTQGIQRVDDRAERYFMRPSECQNIVHTRPLDPVDGLVCLRLAGADVEAAQWWDAALGKPLRVLPTDMRDAKTIDLVRRNLRTASWQRDSQGRRVWIRDGVVERDGDMPALPVGLWKRQVPHRRLTAVPGGWYGWISRMGTARQQRIFVDVETGGERPAGSERKQHLWGWNILSPEHVLDYERDAKGHFKPGGKRSVAPLGADEPNVLAKNTPTIVGRVIGRDAVLALRGPKWDLTLHVWNPRTGQTRELPWLGRRPDLLRGAAVHGYTGDGRLLLQLDRGTSLERRISLAVLSADREHVRLIADGLASWVQPIALLKDDALVAIQDTRRVVRLAPDKPVEVLFPR